mgnify:FL=1
MKKTSKALLLSLCAVLLVTASVLGTMAYLTSQDQVVNTFTVGNVAITLDEKDVDNSTLGENDRDKANAYKLMPGHNYEKDPIVHVDANSEDCYLFVKVVNEIANIEAEKTVAQQMTEKGWVAVDAANGIYVYTTDKTNPAVVTKGSNITVFENFTIAGYVDNTTLATYADKTITVNAYAIQADGFAGKTASEIWAAAGFNN